MDLLTRPWPWWIVGPLIGLTVPALLLAGNKLFGISSALRHICAAAAPGRVQFLRYDWRRTGMWNFAFVLGVVAGGFLAGVVFANPDPIAISAATRADLAALGIQDFHGLMPADLFRWNALLTAPGLIVLVGGGLLVGFGTAYAGGCTSGHGIAGLADLQLPSFIATLAFFTGGIAATFLLLPLVLG